MQAVSSSEFQSSIVGLPSSTVMSPHLIKKVAVQGGYVWTDFCGDVLNSKIPRLSSLNIVLSDSDTTASQEDSGTADSGSDGRGGETALEAYSILSR